MIFEKLLYVRLFAIGVHRISVIRGRSRLDIEGARTPRRPLPNAVRGVIGRHRTAEIYPLRRDAHSGPKIIFENIVF